MRAQNYPMRLIARIAPAGICPARGQLSLWRSRPQMVDGNRQAGIASKLPADALAAMAEGLARQLECYVSVTDCEEEVEAFLAALRRDGWQVSPPSGEPHNSETQGNR